MGVLVRERTVALGVGRDRVEVLHWRRLGFTAARELVAAEEAELLT